MLNNQDSNMAANAICHAAQMSQASMQEAMALQTAPSFLFKPKVFPDGNKWCALYGDDIQIGVAGFGDSPAKAMQDFDNNWFKDMEQKS